MLKGVVFTRMERLDDAVKAYRDLIDIDAANAEAHNNLGLIYLEQGNCGRASNELASAVRYKPDYAQPITTTASF